MPCPLVCIPQFLPHLTQTLNNLMCERGRLILGKCSDFRIFLMEISVILLDFSVKCLGFLCDFWRDFSVFFWICHLDEVKQARRATD